MILNGWIRLSTILLTLWAIALPSASAFYNAKDGSSLVHKLTLKGDRYYYGSAILYRIEKDRAYFLTNAHVIPSAKRLPLLRLSGINQKETPALAVRVEGAAPGFDVAVLSVNLRSKAALALQGDLLKKYQWLIENRIFRGTHLDTRKVEVEVKGYQDISSYSEAQFPDDIGSTTFAKPRAAVYSTRDTRTIRRSIDDPLIERRTVCPTLQLQDCYLIRYPTNGFSGGAVLALRGDVNKALEQSMILGMVSHFSPLANETYAIPIHHAIRIGNELISLPRPKSPTAYPKITRHRGSPFEYINNRQVRIIAGPLSGRIVTSNSSFSAGGGDVSHAGGDASRGGGDASRGGGGWGEGYLQLRAPTHLTSSRYQTLRNFPEGDARFQMSLDYEVGPHTEAQMLKDFSQPEDWLTDRRNLIHRGFRFSEIGKGLDAVFGFRPGVKVDGKLVYGLRGPRYAKKTEFLQEFLSVYFRFLLESALLQTKPDISLIQGFSSQPLPTHLGTREEAKCYDTQIGHAPYWRGWIGSDTTSGQDYVAVVEIEGNKLSILDGGGNSEGTGTRMVYILPRAIRQISPVSYRYFGPIQELKRTEISYADGPGYAKKLDYLDRPRAVQAAIFIHAGLDPGTYQLKMFLAEDWPAHPGQPGQRSWVFPEWLKVGDSPQVHRVGLRTVSAVLAPMHGK